MTDARRRTRALTRTIITLTPHARRAGHGRAIGNAARPFRADTTIATTPRSGAFSRGLDWRPRPGRSPPTSSRASPRWRRRCTASRRSRHVPRGRRLRFDRRRRRRRRRDRLARARVDRIGAAGRRHRARAHRARRGDGAGAGDRRALARDPDSSGGQGELTTPTGAAILAATVDTFGPPPPMRVRAIGYGAGTRELADRANVLRVLVGEPLGRSRSPPRARSCCSRPTSTT